MNLMPYVIIWAVLAAIVLFLVVYRKVVSGKEDDTLHVSDATSATVAQQREIAQKLSVIDRWGKILTAIALVYGLALAAGYVYLSWIEHNQAIVR